MKAETQQIKLHFGDELMEVIAACAESMELSFDEYAKELTPERITELHSRIMPVFMTIHKRGMADAKAIYDQGRTL